MKAKKKIDISIIVPIYNTSKYLKKCINSLINQTHKNIEIILINDGSSDNSEEIVLSFNDERIKYTKNTNQGIGKTRNEGIKKSLGKYIMFIDSDDYIADDCCELMFNKAEETNSDIVVSDYYKDRNGEMEIFKIVDFEPTSLKDNKDLLLKINLGPCNKIYKSNLLKKNNILFEEYLKYEDVPFVLECLKHSKKVAKINTPLSYYCIHENSETTRRDNKMFDIIEIVDKIRNSFKKTCFEEQIDYLTVDIITNYTIQQRYQKNKAIRNRFIDECFDYLENNIKDYKNKKYYNNKSFIRRKIESSKKITKLYCNIASLRYCRR